jgi:hypothetical protein
MDATGRCRSSRTTAAVDPLLPGAGGFAPLIAAALLQAWGWPAVALYMAVMAAVTVVATLLATETYQSDIHADDLREQELVEPGVTPSARP